MACLGLNTWKALVPAPGLFNEEKGRDEDGEVTPPTSDDISGEFPSLLLTPCVWFHPENAGCGDTTTAGGGVEMPPLSNMGGAILTGDRIAFGRGKSLELLTEETIWTGPFPTPPPLVPSVSMSSSSDPLDRSLPDSPESLLLDELDVLEVEDVLFRVVLRSPLPVSGIRGGIPVAEMAATRTLPMLEMWREEEEEERARGGGCALVSAGMGLLRGLLAAGGATEVETVLTVRVVRVEGVAVGPADVGASVVEMEMIGYETTNFCFPATKPAPIRVEGVSGTLFCRTLEIVLDIFTAVPPLPTGFLACRLVPAFEAMLFETEFMMAVALAIPCFVRLAGLEVGGRGDPPLGDREGWCSDCIDEDGTPDTSYREIIAQWNLR